MRVGQARRRDANEKAVKDALEAVGAYVIQISAPGAPDLLVGFRGRWTPIEVKSEKGTLTPMQWGSYGANPYPIVRSPDEAIFVIAGTR